MIDVARLVVVAVVLQTAKRIRASEAAQPGRRTPILALTANTLVEDRYACFEAGMDGFLIKPVDREKLAANLSKQIDPSDMETAITTG